MVGAGVSVGNGVLVSVGVNVGDGMGVSVGVSVGPGVGVMVGVPVSVGDALGGGTGVLVAVGGGGISGRGSAPSGTMITPGRSLDGGVTTTTGGKKSGVDVNVGAISRVGTGVAGARPNWLAEEHAVIQINEALSSSTHLYGWCVWVALSGNCGSFFLICKNRTVFFIARAYLGYHIFRGLGWVRIGVSIARNKRSYQRGKRPPKNIL